MHRAITPSSPAFWSAYRIQMRPYLLFVSGIAGWTGIAFAGDLATPRLAAAFAACFLGYGFGQALTDCFQKDTDALSSPYRPLVRGELSTRDVFVVSIGGLIVCTLLLALANPHTLPVASGAVLGLLSYTWFKRRWWGGPPCNAAVVALLVPVGALAAIPGSTPASILAHPGLPAAVSAAFFGYAHFVLTGYFKDVEADRATGYDTLPVRFGRTAAAWVADATAVTAVLSASASVHAVATGTALPLAGLLLVAGAAAFGLSSVRLHRVKTDRDAFRSIVPGLHGYLLTLGAVIVAHNPAWIAGLALFHGLFVRTLARRPEISQV